MSKLLVLVLIMLTSVVDPLNLRAASEVLRPKPGPCSRRLCYKAVGRKQALADFTGKKSPFADRDLYVFCVGSDRVTVANGGFPSFVGTSVDALKDADGKPLGKTLWETGSGKGQGSVEYQWINPLSHKTDPKVSFVQKVGEDVCGVGAYNPKG
jgi:Single Cache domain 2